MRYNAEKNTIIIHDIDYNNNSILLVIYRKNKIKFSMPLLFKFHTQYAR